MRYTGPKNKLARRERTDLGLKTPGSKAHSSLLRKINIAPGQHGTTRFRKLTDYGLQLRQAQTLKRIYGLSQTQMKNYFISASKKKGNTAEHLSQHIQTRLDNTLYQLGFAPTRASARQLIAHGHICVNGKKVSIPSYCVSQNDTISFLKPKSAEIPYIQESLKRKDTIIPKWLKRTKDQGSVISLPGLENLEETVDIQQVVEFYSR